MLIKVWPGCACPDKSSSSMIVGGGGGTLPSHFLEPVVDTGTCTVDSLDGLDGSGAAFGDGGSSLGAPARAVAALAHLPKPHMQRRP